MDANDEKRINEQLNLLENSQQIMQHAIKNQIKIINANIIHVGKLEDILERNEKAYIVRVKEYLFREEITEHFTIITTIISDLVRDVENMLEYLAHLRNGKMYPKIIPIDTIIAQLK